MTQIRKERDQTIHHLLLCLLAKTQDQNASLIAKQKNLTSSRNTSQRNWERQKETVMKLLDTTMTSEKFVFSENTNEKEDQIQQIKDEKDKLRRFSQDQKLIMQRQEKYISNSSHSYLMFSDFNQKERNQTKNKKMHLTDIIKNTIKSEEDNIKDLKNDIDILTKKIKDSLESIDKIEQHIKIHKEENERLKNRKQQILNERQEENMKYQHENIQSDRLSPINMRKMSKEDLIQLKNELTIECIGGEEIIEKNKNLKDRLKELQTITDEDLVGKGNVTKPFLQENSEERTKLKNEIDSLKDALKKIDNQFLAIKDGIQKFSQINPLDFYFH